MSELTLSLLPYNSHPSTFAFASASGRTFHSTTNSASNHSRPLIVRVRSQIISKMDTIVQLIRNGLCCIKDLNLFPDSGIHAAAELPLPEPMNKTTPLEFLIAISQFYAFVSVSMSGFSLLLDSGYRKLRRVEKIQMKHKNTGGTADAILMERLDKEKATAKKNMFIGANVFSIGVCFFWLTANSLHVTETDWIGGIQALIHALTIMEVALVPLLYFMIADSIMLIGKASVMEYLAKILRKCNDKVPAVILTDDTFAVLLQKGWTPFWAGKSSLDDDDEEQEITKEVSNLVAELEAWTNEKDNTAMKATIKETAARLDADAVTTRYQAYREIFYFLLNFVAFYGYMIGVLVYYKNAEDHEQPIYVRGLKLGLSNNDADWTGNFAGDLMWTIGKNYYACNT